MFFEEILGKYIEGIGVCSVIFSSHLILKEREAQRVLLNTRKFRFLGLQEKGWSNLIELLNIYGCLI